MDASTARDGAQCEAPTSADGRTGTVLRVWPVRSRHDALLTSARPPRERSSAARLGHIGLPSSCSRVAGSLSPGDKAVPWGMRASLVEEQRFENCSRRRRSLRSPSLRGTRWRPYPCWRHTWRRSVLGPQSRRPRREPRRKKQTRTNNSCVFFADHEHAIDAAWELRASRPASGYPPQSPSCILRRAYRHGPRPALMLRR